MNHSKIVLVACISAFVALTTAFLGVAGTIIGSVLSSVLYNVLSEILEKPVENAKISANFEWDIAYVFPLIVVLLIQLMLILAFLSEWGILPNIFLNIYLSIQGIASNNLYRVLGLSLIIMSVYPFVLRRNYVKKSDGLIILIIGLIFLGRGFSDVVSDISYVYGVVFQYIDVPIALIAFLLLIYVINSIISSAKESDKLNVRQVSNHRTLDDSDLKHIRRRQSNINLDDLELKQVQSKRQKSHHNASRNPQRNNNYQSGRKINESINDIHFESNDLLDDYKK